MSVRLMGQVFYMPRLSASEKLALLALADFANDEGVCWPNMAQIAEKANMTERGVRGVIRRLEDRGFVQREERRGRGQSNVYILTLKPEPENRNSVPVTDEKPEPDCTKTGTPLHSPPHPPYKDNHQEPSKKISSTPHGVLCAVLSRETARAVVEHRQRISRPLTAEAARRMAKELEKCPDPEAAANEMLLRGWRGFKAEWVAPKDEPSRVDPRKVLGLP